MPNLPNLLRYGKKTWETKEREGKGNINPRGADLENEGYIRAL